MMFFLGVADGVCMIWVCGSVSWWYLLGPFNLPLVGGSLQFRIADEGEGLGVVW